MINRYVILGAVIVLGASLGLNAYQHARIATIKLQRDQNAAQLKFCAKQHTINQKVTHEYETELSNLDEQLRLIRLRERPACTVVKPARKPDAKTPVGELPAGDGLRTDWLYDYAGRCQKDALKLKSLQEYINQTRGR